uniref:uncharacterized protein si:dkey-205h13.2 n=1 Tax=Doryrhamphus excisus TaxID=161450 RepID=UPI0025ADA43B|nr:uncharacterized protein si:dkey-205h13.2 [Doryrhamphus excisus]
MYHLKYCILDLIEHCAIIYLILQVCVLIAALHAGNEVQAGFLNGRSSRQCWTPWFSRNNASGRGDFETLKKLRLEHPSEICPVPIGIEVQTVSGDNVSSTGDNITVSDATRGFICKNEDQSSGQCSDYRVRFKCPINFCPIEECWTPWLNGDKPSDDGDFETLVDLHNAYEWQICEHPIEIQVKTASGKSVESTGDVIYAADTKTGFVCRTCDQPKGLCSDYQVRFMCPLEFCKPDVCYTRWFNQDSPSKGNGDSELLGPLRRKFPDAICEYPIDIEVETVDGHKPSTTGDIIHIADPAIGFSCKNDDQKSGICFDYRVRFICPSHFCKDQDCYTKWFDRDNPAGRGDFETLASLRDENPYQICKHPLDIEVQTTDGFTVAATGDAIAVADTITGFVCENYGQPHGGLCSDYRVRFRCPLDFCNPPVCWTEWLNSDNPRGGGDFETLTQLRSKFPNKICDVPVEIKVETKSGGSVDSTGDVIYVADTETGFICKNSDQKKGICSDYRVRFECPLDFCHANVCFTDWFNSDSPNGTGDFELFEKISTKYPDVICDHPVSIEVVTADDGYPFVNSGQIPYKFSPSEGFACRHSDQKGEDCYDYQITKKISDKGLDFVLAMRTRLLFQVDKKPYGTDPILPEHPPQETSRDTVQYLFQDHKPHVDRIGKLCTSQYPCKGVDLYLLELRLIQVAVDFLRKTNKSSRDKSTGSFHWDRVHPAGDPSPSQKIEVTLYLRLPASTIWTDDNQQPASCMDRNMASSIMIVWAFVLIAALHVGNNVEAATGCYTKWFDRDDPSGNGDYETLRDLQKENPGQICQTPIDIEVLTTSGMSVASTGEVIATWNTKVGFICQNSDQKNGFCSDYRVRFKCPVNFCAPKGCYTRWFDRDDPFGYGDYETLRDLQKENPGQICKSPTDIEVLTTSGMSVASTGDVIAQWNTKVGFVCKNSDQKNSFCSDYRVRFKCPLDFCSRRGCYTKWFDRDDPSGNGDYETLRDLQREHPGQICPTPRDIEVQTTSGMSVASTGDVIDTSDAKTGFICKNVDQKHGMCSDYRIRFWCPFCPPSEMVPIHRVGPV